MQLSQNQMAELESNFNKYDEKKNRLEEKLATMEHDHIANDEESIYYEEQYQTYKDLISDYEYEMDSIEEQVNEQGLELGYSSISQKWYIKTKGDDSRFKQEIRELKAKQTAQAVFEMNVAISNISNN